MKTLSASIKDSSRRRGYVGHRHWVNLPPSPSIFFLKGTIDSAISFRTLWTTFWLAKTSNEPISLMTWLAVNPLTCNLYESSTRAPWIDLGLACLITYMFDFLIEVVWHAMTLVNVWHWFQLTANTASFLWEMPACKVATSKFVCKYSSRSTALSDAFAKRKRKKRKTTQAIEHPPHQVRKETHWSGAPYTPETG